MPQLSVLVKTLKKYALDINVSDEEFVNALLHPFVVAGKITNKNKDEFYLNKSRVSELLNQKKDVPKRLRKALQIIGIEEKTENNMSGFIDDYLDRSRVSYLIKDLADICNNNETIVAAGNFDFLDDRASLEHVLTVVLIRSISDSNLADANNSVILRCGSNTVEIISGDIFRYGFGNRRKKKNIVVIPVNTTFDTHVTRKLENEGYPLVSENTLHGQWLIRETASGTTVDEIDARISASLKNLGFAPVGEANSVNGKRVSYPVGAVAIIEEGNAVYFLIAISAFDKFNNARSVPSDIEKSIQSLIEVYDRYGQGYDMYVPLMGTGRSRSGLSPNESYKLMKKLFIENKEMIHGHIFLIIKPEDREELLMEE